jgi:putative transposase
MTCPYCQSHCLQKLKRTTDLGYLAFRWNDCGRKSNERTGTPFNFLEFPTDIVFEIVLYRLRYKLSLRNLAEMLLLRGFQFTHEAVRDWEAHFAPLLAEQLRRKRKGKVGRRWYLDETYVKVNGKWSYLYRATDRAGNLVDSLLSATRDMAAAQRFFRGTLSVIEKDPLQITTDGHFSYPRAIREVLGPKVKHRCNAYLTRPIEQDHRGIKQRYYPMLGFGSLHSGSRFCRAFEEVRQYFRPRHKRKQFVPLAKQRRQFLFRALAFGLPVRSRLSSRELPIPHHLLQSHGPQF